MNRVGMHFIYWSADGKNRSIEDLIRLTKKTGVDFLELNQNMIIGMSQQERRDLKNRFSDEGLPVNFNGGLDAANDIASDDASVRKSGIEYSKRALQAISELGSTSWSGINYSAWLRRPEEYLTPEEKQRVFDLSVGSMRHIIKTAEDYGIVYGFEIVNRYEQFLLNTAKEGVDYCEAVGSKNAQLLLDTFHMNIEEDDMRQAIIYAGQKNRLAHFHIGESNRRIPGVGASHIDWKGVFAALKTAGYSGYITMEPIVRMGHPKICVWRNLAEDLFEEGLIADASKGAAFIRKMIIES